MAFGWRNEFTLNNEFAEPEYRLQAPVIGRTEAPSLGNFASQLSTPEMPQTDYSNIIGAGIGAAGKTVGALAEIAGRKAAMDRAAESNALGREHQAQLVKMQLAASREGADQARKMGAYQLLLKAFGNQMGNVAGGRENERRSAGSASDMLAQAMLRGR